MKKLLLLLAIFLFSACKKGGDDVNSKDNPKAELAAITTTVPLVFSTSANFTLETKTNANSPTSERGVCYGTSPTPLITGTKEVVVNDKPNEPVFEIQLRNLTVNVKYYARAYAINKAGIVYGNEIQFTTFYRIGEAFGGGKIFFVDNTKVHGLIADTYDLATQIPYAPGNLFVVSTGATSTTNGKTNTDLIIAKYGTGGTYAAKACKDHRGSGFSDWYLPSKNELLELLNTKISIGNFQTDKLQLDDYWSSTEYDYFQAYISEFGWGYSLSNSYGVEKRTLGRVRAIRGF